MDVLVARWVTMLWGYGLSHYNATEIYIWHFISNMYVIVQLGILRYWSDSCKVLLLKVRHYALLNKSQLLYQYLLPLPFFSQLTVFGQKKSQYFDQSRSQDLSLTIQICWQSSVLLLYWLDCFEIKASLHWVFDMDPVNGLTRAE